MNYDPNLTNSGRMAIQTVELTFQQWEYSKTETVFIGGNCKGLSVIESAIDHVEEKLGYDDGEIILKNKDGQKLICALGECNLSRMLVSARITGIKPISHNEN